MNILWCVTGGGQFLEESHGFMKKLAEENRVTVALSRAGCEVAGMYGLLEDIKRIFPEVVLEKKQGASSPLVGRLSKREYERVIVAPCTANTVAKIVYGIADSLVTNVVAQAGKCGVPVFILPTDGERLQETQIPLNIDYSKCMDCRPCPPMENCPSTAFFISGRVRVNLLRCNACKKCIQFCAYEAIGFNEKTSIGCRDVDLKNVVKIGGMKGIHVVKDITGLEIK